MWVKVDPSRTNVMIDNPYRYYKKTLRFEILYQFVQFCYHPDAHLSKIANPRLVHTASVDRMAVREDSDTLDTMVCQQWCVKWCCIKIRTP